MNLISVLGHMLYVAAGAAHHYLLQHYLPHMLVDDICSSGKNFWFQVSSLRHQGVVLLYPGCKGVCDVADAIYCALGVILE